MSLREGISKSSGRVPRGLFFELIIIFVGVYGAFWVERYQQQLEDRDRALSILEALTAEIDEVRNYGPLVVEGMDAALGAFDEAVAQGQMIAPAYYREPDAETPSVSIWEATVASGGVNLLDPQLFYELASYYHRVNSFSQRYLRYNAFTETELLPLLSQGAEAFYDPRTRELESVFSVHMDQFRILREDASDILRRAQLLVPKIQEEMERLR